MALNNIAASGLIYAEDIRDELDAIKVTKLVKGADQSFPSTTLANDSDIAFNVLAGTNYVFRMWLVLSGDTAADAKIAMTFPLGAEIYYGGFTVDTSLAVASFAQNNPASGTAVVIGVGGVATYRSTQISGSLLVAGTAGTLRLQVAQNAGSATATVLEKGSFMEIGKAV